MANMFNLSSTLTRPQRLDVSIGSYEKKKINAMD